MSYLLKGVNFRHPHLTKDLRVWWQYFCWCVHAWMMSHRPYYPQFIRVWALRHYGSQRYHMSWRMVEQWRRVDPNYVLKKEWRPLPWWLGESALGAFLKPWDRAERWFRQRTGERSHRCEFTDAKEGALYGGQRGAFMDEYFEQLIRNIDESE